MKFRTGRDTLLRPLRVVTGVVERRPTLPILSNLLLEADAKGLTVRGTDLEVEVVARLEEGIEVEQPGATTVPAHKLADIWQSLPESASIGVALEGDRAVVRSGRSRFSLATIPTSDFPEGATLLGGVEEEPSGAAQDADAADAKEAGSAAEEAGSINIVLRHADLRRLLDRTKFAMANGDVRYFLNGMLLELTAKDLRAVATDGHRMALFTLDGAGAEGVNRQRLIVPRKSVQDLERLIADSDADVGLTLGRNTLQVAQGAYTLTTKLVDGQFPEVDRLVPRNTDHSITGHRQTLREALHRVAILSNEKSQDVRLEMDGEQLTIRANNPEQEEAEEIVAVDYDGSAMEIGFNVRYIQDVLNALETDSIKVSMPKENNIAVIEGVGAEDSLYLVMPLRR